MNRRRILIHEWVTGGGLAGSELPASWASEGAAMRRALAADFARLEGVEVVATLDARLPDDPGPWETVAVGPGAEPETLTRLSARADCTILIAPETGGILADRTRRVADAGGRSLGSTAPAIALTADKWAFQHWLIARGIATPTGRLVDPAEGLPADFPYPAVLKPIDGAGAIDTYFVADAGSVPAGRGIHPPQPPPCKGGSEEGAISRRPPPLGKGGSEEGAPSRLPPQLAKGGLGGVNPSADGPPQAGASSTDPRALLQPWVEGTPMSASYLIGPDGRARLIAAGWQRVHVVGNRYFYEGGTLPAPRQSADGAPRRAVESVPGLLGFVGVDYLWIEAERRAVVLEINPRPTTSVVGLVRVLSAGVLARAWLNLFEEPSDPGAGELAASIEARDPITFAADGSIGPAGDRSPQRINSS